MSPALRRRRRRGTGREPASRAARWSGLGLLVAVALLGCRRGEVAIAAVQGRGAMSPLVGQVVAVSGVVTGVLDENAFFVQSLRADRSASTSEGLLVRGGGVASGDLVRVRGLVREEQRTPSELPVTVLAGAGAAAGDGGDDSAMAAAEVTVLERGRPLPAAVAAPDPSTLGDARRAAAAWEALEGMLVRLPGATVIGPATRFGEVAVLPGGAAPDALRTASGGLLDDDPRRARGEPLLLDDELAELGTLAGAAVGDRVDHPLVGVVDYRFGAYRVYPLEAPRPVTPEPRAPERAEPAPDGHLSIATLNVENLDLGDPPARFRALGEYVVERLGSPDLLLLQEVQDDSGPQNDGRTSSDATLGRLANVIAARGGPAYAHRYVRPDDGADGGEPGGNIRTVLLLRRDRGLRFVDRPPLDEAPGAGHDRTARVLAGSASVELRPSPARIAPAHPAFRDSRKPLAVELRVGDTPLWVIGVHLASKRADDPVAGAYRPPRRRSTAQRTAQARQVAALVRTILDHEPQAWVLALGDFNDGVGSPPLVELERAGLHDLMAGVPAAERYSYVFQGRSQLLDHVLASSALLACCSPAVDVLHGNADAPAAGRLSDHDPVVATFRVGAAP